MAENTENTEKPEGSKSIRRRLTTSIKRVMSSYSSKSAKSASPLPADIPPTPGSPPPVKEKTKLSAPTWKYRPPVISTKVPFPLTSAERARELFKKYDVDISTTDWPFVNSAPPLERVHREIRMRVRRTCHKCDTTFGTDKVCEKCSHRRCKACPKYPVKKSKDKGKGKEKLTTVSPTGYKKRPGDLAYGLTRPGRRGGQDLVRKEARQRVHRTCHRCQVDFANEKVCTNCKHTRCKRCPYFPHKPGKPLEYYSRHDPSDSEPEPPPPPRRTLRRPRRRVHWVCSKCSSTFTEPNKLCPGCGSRREDTGIRDPPKKHRHDNDYDS